jgi:hypothetical protein
MFLNNLFQQHTPDIIEPWNADAMQRISQKLHVSSKELNDAILDTGSLNYKTVQNYIKLKKQQSNK